MVEIEGSSPGTFFFKEATPERLLQHAWLKPHFLTEEGRVIASIHCFVIQSEGRTIVVDTCVGNDKPREVKSWHMRQGKFLADLAEAGFPRERVDTVLCTHLHVDHVGWNTMLKDGKWVPTFPNARYLFGSQEWEYWSKEAEGPEREVRNDSVRPILETGLADLVAMDHCITSKGEEAVITGDLMHHPVQCAEPGWAGNFDVDPDAARRTRRAFLERYSSHPILVLGTHFATPTGGRIVRDRETFRFAA